MREVSAVIFDCDSGKLSRISSRSSALNDMRFEGGLGEIWIGGDRRPGWLELKNCIPQIKDHLVRLGYFQRFRSGISDPKV
jgi:hypothetical protein